MSDPEPIMIPLRGPWDMTLLFLTPATGKERRLMDAIAQANPTPKRRLAPDQKLELGHQAIELLGPEFDADEFREVVRRLGAGKKFTAKNASQMLDKLCRSSTLKKKSPGTLTKAAVYRVPKRPRSR